MTDRLRFAKWVAVALWAVVILGFSSLPGTSVPGGPGGTAAHFAEYAILGALLVSAIGIERGESRAVVLALLIASAYAVTDELHQSFVPMRTPDVTDWIVDTAGAVAGALAAMVWLRRRARG